MTKMMTILIESNPLVLHELLADSSSVAVLSLLFRLLSSPDIHLSSYTDHTHRYGIISTIVIR